MSSHAFVLYMVAIKPFQTSGINWYVLANETFYSTLIIAMFIFSDATPELNIKFGAAVALIAALILIVFANLLTNIVYMIRGKEKLKNDNFNIENEFKQKLKELENESIRLENHISSLKEQKADILAEIVEAERQMLMWERKIQLEKAMQDELDPTIGQTEIVAMKKEIHRMELRYEQLRKK